MYYNDDDKNNILPRTANKTATTCTPLTIRATMPVPINK